MSIKIQTFPKFQITVGNIHVPLRNQTRELLAYLVTAQGREVSNKELIEQVLKQKESKKSLQHLRVVFFYLKKELENMSIQNIIGSSKNGRYRFARPELYKCDMEQVMKGNQRAIANYGGEYMEEYTWNDSKKQHIDRVVKYYKTHAV